MAPLLLLTCDCGAGPIGGGAETGGFIPVPDGSEGTIHQWGIEGAQPEDKVRIRFVKQLLQSCSGKGFNIGVGKGNRGISRDILTLSGELRLLWMGSFRTPALQESHPKRGHS